MDTNKDSSSRQWWGSGTNQVWRTIMFLLVMMASFIIANGVTSVLPPPLFASALPVMKTRHHTLDNFIHNNQNHIYEKEQRVNVLCTSIRQEATLIYNNMSAHNESHYLTNAALGFLLDSTRGQDSIARQPSLDAVQKFVDILDYMFHSKISFGALSFGGVFVATTLRRFAGSLPITTLLPFIETLVLELPTQRNQANANDVSYNNMYLMEAINLITIGEALHDILDGVYNTNNSNVFIHSHGLDKRGQPFHSRSLYRSDWHRLRERKEHGQQHGMWRERARNAISSGYMQLTQWFVYARENGIHEFVSPTYTWVQLESMTNGYLWIKDSSARQRLKAALDHVWAQLSANMFHGASNTYSSSNNGNTETGIMTGHSILSGPHSRDYDTLFGRGGLYTNLYMQGLIDVPNECEEHDLHCEDMGPNTVDTGNVYIEGKNLVGLALQNVICLTNALAIMQSWANAEGYTPDAKALSLAHTWDKDTHARTVQSKFGNGTSSTRYNFVMADQFAIGSVSEDYITDTHVFFTPCPQSKAVSVVVANDWSLAMPMPNLVITPHWEDIDVYGREERPVHLPMHQMSIQHRSEMLIMMLLNGKFNDLDGFSVPHNASFLSTNIILPKPKISGGRYGGGVAYSTYHADRELRQNDVMMLPSNVLFNNSSWIVETGSTIAIRVGSVAIVIRVLDAEACAKHHIAMYLRGDDGHVGGLEYGAIRFEVRHYHARRGHDDVGDTILEACATRHIRVALMVSAYPLKTSPPVVPQYQYGGQGDNNANTKNYDEELAQLVSKVMNAKVSANHTDKSTGASQTWRVEMHTPNGAILEGARLLDTNPLETVGKSILYRRVNGEDVYIPNPAYVNVNGLKLFPLE